MIRRVRMHRLSPRTRPRDRCPTAPPANCRRGDRMKRREVITGLIGSLAFPRGLAAQPAERTYRLGVLSPGLSSYDTLRGQLAKLGFIEGRNLVVDVRVGAPDQLPRMAHELVATKPDVVMAVSAAVAAMKAASSTVPLSRLGRIPLRKASPK